MNKLVLIILGIIALIAVLGVLIVYYYYTSITQSPKYDLKNSKVLIVIFSGYNNIEYTTTRDYLKSCGANVTVLSMHKNVGTKYDIYIGDINDLNLLADQYDVVVFIGGGGVYDRVVGAIKDGSVEKAAKIATLFYNKGKLVSAICAAPGILAKTDIIKGKKITCYSDKTLINMVEKCGATYTGKNVEQDGRIITAIGPDAARDFAVKIAENLAKG
ncbi:MAG: hypothetical protein DRJ47_01330 [Thermoprotei archaeon]|nr:MAG: hypothetical protein DRJ47_01330 [Thermoprotei archaeon]